MRALRRWLSPAIAFFCSSLLFAEALPQVKLLEPPTYPPEAQRARIAGTVKIDLELDQSGNVEKSRIISGHPALAAAAKANIRSWQFDCEEHTCTRHVTVEFVFRIEHKMPANSSPVITLQLPRKVTVSAAASRRLP